MTTTPPSDLKNSRIVLVDASSRQLLQYADALLSEGYVDCVPAYYRFSPFGNVVDFSLLEMVQENVKRHFPKASDDTISEYAKRIIPFNSSETVPFLTQLKPELVILETRLGGSRGYEYFNSLKTALPEVKIIGMSDDPNHSQQWAEAGADDFYCETDTTNILEKKIRFALEEQS